jgi:UDP-glucose 4-epimerase
MHGESGLRFGFLDLSRRRNRVMRVLVCGGAGYIGLHVCLDLDAKNHDVTLLDNFSNASRKIRAMVERFSNRRIGVVEADIRDVDLVSKILRDRKIEAVIHLAGLKSVDESQSLPLEYFDNNIGGSIALLKAMASSGVNALVFSSSAAVYGDQHRCPISEHASLSVTSPYGRTKLIIEQLIDDCCAANHLFKAAVLRYFNPVGVSHDLHAGEKNSIRNGSAMNNICAVVSGELSHFTVHGDDYLTRDGTCIRDYVHIDDLARVHGVALDYIVSRRKNVTVNVGTGRGCSVLELVRAFEAVSGFKIPLIFGPRRDGDIAESYAAVDLAQTLFQWRASYDLRRICDDVWRGQFKRRADVGVSVY